MRKLLLAALVLVMAVASSALADTVYARLGPLSLPIPWNTTSLVYLYNMTMRETQVGGEMAYASLQVASLEGRPIKLNATAGGSILANSNNLGSAFLGFRLTYETAGTPSWWEAVKPGITGGYDLRAHLWWWGFKSSFSLFQ